MRPLLVGEVNPRSADPKHALYPWPSTSAGGRLAALLGLTPREYLAWFDRVNLFHHVPQEWRVPNARYAAGTVLAAHPGHHVIVLLGRRVAQAFRAEDLPLWKAIERGTRTYVRIPHPSGRCRAWNDPASTRKLRRLLLKGAM